MMNHKMDFYILLRKTKIFVKYLGNNTYQCLVNHSVDLPIQPKNYCKIWDDETVFSFDYICSSSIWMIYLVIAKKYSFGFRNIRVSDKWQSLTIDIASYIEAVEDLLYLSEDSLVLTIIAFPTSSTVDFRIRNIRLRPCTEEEEGRRRKRMAYSVRKSLPHICLKDYFYGTEFPCAVSSVAAGSDLMTVRGTVCQNGRGFGLCEIPVFSEFAPAEFREVCAIEAGSDGSFNVSFPRKTTFAGYVYDRIFSRFAVAVESPDGWALASHARYAGQGASEYSIPSIVPKNKKGLGGFESGEFESDLDDLGISYVTVNIRVNDFLRSKAGRGTVPFSYDGVTCHADLGVIEKYDATMLAAAKRRIVVSAIILVCPENRSRDPNIGHLLEHPEYDAAGAYCMPDLTTPESVSIYAAALDFLASRYGRPDGRYGHIHRWIVHNEVDSAWIWCNAGRKSALEFVDLYLKSMRMVYFSALKYNANAEVYVSLTHCWKAAFDSSTCYPGRQVLKLMQEVCRAEGDFPWGIAYHAYPETLWEPKSWLDRHAVPNEDTELVTFRNIEVLDRWAGKRENRFNGRPRSVMLSEQNPNSVDYSEKCQREQAAGLAYIWRKVQDCENIEAYIAHSWIDDREEGGLKTGLRKYPDDPDDPCGRKSVWHVMRDVGTEREKEVYDAADKIIRETTKYDIPV